MSKMKTNETIETIETIETNEWNEFMQLAVGAMQGQAHYGKPRMLRRSSRLFA